MNKSLVIAILLSAVTSVATAQKVVPSLPAATFANVSYGTHERHVLDFWQAKTKDPAPLLIFIHGGGWHGGEKTDLPVKLLTLMLKRGVSVASLNYRYTSMAPAPGPEMDAARAVQFLRSKAGEWKLDPQRFGAYGISAGATSSLWLAYHDDLAETGSVEPIARQSTRLIVAVALSPQTCLEPAIAMEWIGEQVVAHPMIMRAVGAKSREEIMKPKPEWVKALHESSPYTHVSAGDPPVLISNPRVDPLPATTPGSAIHHAVFGTKLKEKADSVGATCVLFIQEQDKEHPLTAEDFLLKHLTGK